VGFIFLKYLLLSRKILSILKIKKQDPGLKKTEAQKLNLEASNTREQFSQSQYF
jgi:hypothetical protein